MQSDLATTLAELHDFICGLHGGDTGMDLAKRTRFLAALQKLRTGNLIALPDDAVEVMTRDIIDAGYNPATARGIANIALAALTKGADQ